jgi:formylglycine-generating enzyme required for sulfatase activity
LWEIPVAMNDSGPSNYERFDKIGRTNCATLYEGIDQASDREVIIMELADQFRPGQPGWEAVWNDVQKTFRAKLENSVERLRLLGAGQIVVQKIDGNLADLIEKDHKIRPDIVRSALRRALQALQSYADAGIIHGSVKPVSLVHDHMDFIKLAFSPGLQLGGQIPQPCCDYKYMAPELIDENRFGDVGPGVDLYALGITALQLLLGSSFSRFVPGVGQLTDPDSDRWTAWHTSEEIEVPGLQSMIPDIPDDIARVVNRLIRRNVDDRYSSAAEALKDLEDVQDVRLPVIGGGGRIPPPSVPITNTPVGPRKRSFKEKYVFYWKSTCEWLRDPRNALAAVVGALIIGVTVWQLFFTGTPETLVVFETAPEGASVLINEQVLTNVVTPFNGHLPPGKYTLSFQKEGYETLHTEFVVQGDEPEPLLIARELVPGTRTVEISTTPVGAIVKIEGFSGKVPGVTPATVSLPRGEYTLTFILDGYKSETFPVVVPSGGTPLKFSYSLSPDRTLPDGLTSDPDESIHPRLGLPLLALHPASGLEFALIEDRAAFKYGLPSDAGQLLQGELAARPIDILVPFYISTTEVSEAQFALYRADHQIPAGADDLPVVNVSFEDAVEFCSWISSSGRLPFESEWELAAGNGESLHPWPGDALPAPTHCNMQFDPILETSLQSVKATPAGATSNGIHHLLGNVAEWCQDVYVPGSGDADGDPGVGVWPTVRGGSYLNLILPPEHVRITMRASANPSGAQDIGIRVVVPVGEPTSPQRAAR